ncbi:MAG: NAD-dependent epimerase/dehydratase family protein, partial [Solirubrobacterales bacterium]
MRVLVAGATGVIGRPLVEQLRQAGHEVVGTTRSDQRAQTIRELGGEPVVVDARDTDALRRAVVQARPEVVINQLTNLPQKL